MPWVRFVSDFDWRDPRMMRRLVAYRAGQIKMVTTPCAQAALSKGKAVPSNRKEAQDEDARRRG